MRVAFDARSLSGDALRGWDRYTLGLARTFADREVDLLLVGRSGAPIPRDRLDDVRCEMHNLPSGRGPWWEQVALPRALRRLGVDIYHAPAEHGIPFRAPCPTVLTLHSATRQSYEHLVASGKLPGPVNRYVSGPSGLRHRFTSVYWRAQVDRTDFVIAPSEFARDEIVEFLQVPPERVRAIPLAVDRQFTRSRKSDTDLVTSWDALRIQRPYLAYVGGYEPHKNVEGLLTMFKDVRRARPDYTLVLVGTGEVPVDLRTLAGTLGVADATTFLHDLGTELTDLYDGASLFVSMSWRETFCLPALEAMTRGVPAVASAWGATPEVIGTGGRVVDPRHPARFAECVLEMISADGDVALSTAARERSSQYSWDRTADETLAIYRQLAPRFRGGAEA